MCTVSGPPCGCSVAVLGLDDLSLVLLDFRSCRLHHCHVDDVIATINAVRLVPTDERADLLWDALSGHVVDTSPVAYRESGVRSISRFSQSGTSHTFGLRLRFVRTLG